MHVPTSGLLQYTAINIDFAICMDYHTLPLLHILLVLLRVLSDYTHTGVSLHGAAWVQRKRWTGLGQIALTNMFETSEWKPRRISFGRRMWVVVVVVVILSIVILICLDLFTLWGLIDYGFQGVLLVETVSLSIPCHGCSESSCRPTSNALVKYGPNHLSFKNGSMMYHG